MHKISDPGMTLIAALEKATAVFAEWSDTARLDAGTLLSHVLGRSRAWIAAHPETHLSRHDCERYDTALADISTGMPLPYVLGYWEFFGLDFNITREVLIPRPETELLVEAAMKWLALYPDRRLASDIGTGSGCIAISLAVNLPDLVVYASDISEGAISVAAGNIRKHHVERQVHLFQSDLLDGLFEKVDVICANLPYIPSAILQTLRGVKEEPALALDGGKDGLEYIRRMIEKSIDKVKPGGLILLEIQADQGPRVSALAHSVYPTALVHCHQDLAGKDRLVSIALAGESDTISVP
jgi:release factor glutamine methyltransferase